MRTFLAIELDERTRRWAAAAAAKLSALAPELRPTAEAKLHLTLAFLGEIDEAQYFSMATELAAALQEIEPFDLALADGGCFPTHDIHSPKVESPRAESPRAESPRTLRRPRPSVVWIGVGEGRANCGILAVKVAEICRSVGIALESRAFHPHVMVARAKGRRAGRRESRPESAIDGRLDGGLDRWIREMATQTSGAVLRVSSIAVFESEPRAGFATYRRLRRIPLGRLQAE